MKLAFRQCLLLLAVLLVLGCVRTAPVAAQVATVEATTQCKAATPVENPWTKRLPQGWWKKRHEETLSAPGRDACQIIFIGDSITDGWDSEGGGLKVWQKEYLPKKALNLGINCDSTQHVLWRLDHGAIDGLPKLKVAVIEIGTNNVGITRDPPEDIAKGVEAICEKVKQKAPQAKILLLAIFPKGFGANRHDVANGLISQLDDGKQIFYLDINDQLVATEGAIRDRVGHLTEKGYDVWAEEMGPTLEKLMQ
jgi:lysophospholipase L1-like esterase